MNRISRLAVASIVALTGPCVLAGEHNHITVDTVSGAPGDQILIRAGYLPAEGAFTISEGRLLHDGEVQVYDVAEQLTQTGELHDWFVGDAIVLTSDFFFATGRLDGGNFLYELADIHVIEGTHHPEMAWGVFEGASFTPLGRSDAADRAGRSFDVMIGGHRHGQAFVISEAGTFDVTFIAWDSNGVYADSDPVVVRLHVGGTSCPADFNGDGAADSQDFFDYLGAFFELDHAADVNHDEVVNSQDFFEFLTLFFAGC